MKRFFTLLALCVAACSSNGTTNDGGADVANDAPNACNVVTTDASFTCDVSAVPIADRGCDKWIGTPAQLEGGGVSCPAAAGWGGGFGGQGCEYTWDTGGPPDLCELPPAEDGRSAFGWLTPECANGCDASIDVAPPSPCTTSAECASTEYCEVHGNCGGNGTCYPKSGGVGIKQQVCGCDNKTYDSAASAHQVGVSVAYSGACE